MTEDNPSLSIDECIPRHVESNPYEYTTMQLAERKKALLDMSKDYPNLPHSWLEMVYDYWKQTPEQEVQKVINAGEWEGSGKFSKNAGGVLKSMHILDQRDLKPRYVGIRGLDGEM